MNKVQELLGQGFTHKEAIEQVQFEQELDFQAETIEASIKLVENEEQMFLEVADDAYAEDLIQDAFEAANCEVM